MNLEDIILKEIAANGYSTISSLKRKTKLSQPYINRTLQQMRDEGKIVMVGRARNTKYVHADANEFKKVKNTILHFSRRFLNQPGKINENDVFDDIKNTGIFLGLTPEADSILHYAFTEMLNNAIEHSQSKYIEIKINREHGIVMFNVNDNGIGIFNNIMAKKHLGNELEAIQDLLKGKLTTAEKFHSGEGIFFTSKAADNFSITSSSKKIIFNNILDDVFIKDNKKNVTGTTVLFSISEKSDKKLEDIFNRYTDENYDFSKTEVRVKLYKEDVSYVSRSQARRLLAGLEKFKKIILDFKDVESAGQGFADEIFRVWHNNHPRISIVSENTNENVMFMVNRAKANRK
jgi:anti-sigma regulatory factor (Ser/Thr protein kinase)